MTMRWQDTIDVQVKLETFGCVNVNCGIPFAIPKAWAGELRRNAGTMYCPNGHPQGWRETEADRLRRQVRALQLRAEANAADLGAARATLQIERKQHAATKGQLTRARKRAGAGVCPVDGCKRHFANLARHMASKHPDQSGTR